MNIGTMFIACVAVGAACVLAGAGSAVFLIGWFMDREFEMDRKADCVEAQRILDGKTEKD